jgi:hypothetical protein
MAKGKRPRMKALGENFFNRGQLASKVVKGKFREM